jgi:hypothetical protein
MPRGTTPNPCAGYVRRGRLGIKRRLVQKGDRINLPGLSFLAIKPAGGSMVVYADYL